MIWNLAASALGTVADLVAGQRLPILIFHRVLSRSDLLFPEEVDAAKFDALMALVARHFKVFTLGHAVQARKEGLLPCNALVITFDDGYADNAEVALPILPRHGLCATFFVATHFLDGGRMWNDTVIECVRNSSQSCLDLQSFGLGKLELNDHASRRRAINVLLPKLKYASLSRREDSLAELHRLAGYPSLNDGLMMRSSQVRELHKAGMEIGGHTVHHPILTELDDEAAREQIALGRQKLQAITGAPVTVFAYPNGGPRTDYDRRHVAIVHELGFHAAVSTASGLSLPKTDVFQLPRFTPWDKHVGRWLLRLHWKRLCGHQFPTA